MKKNILNFKNIVNSIFYLLILILLTSCDLFLPPSTEFVDLPDGFQMEELSINVDSPTDISFTADGRVLVGGKQGKVWLFEQGATGNVPVFMDISGIVNQSRDRGLTSVRAHPDFPNTPYIYVLFTYDPPETGEFGNASETKDPRGRDGEAQRLGRLMRVTADASKNYSQELPNSRVILVGKNSTWENIGNPAKTAEFDKENWSCHVDAKRDGATIPDCLPADAVTHTVGSIGFGLDGALFLSQGDGASYAQRDDRAYRSYDLNSLAGKILRVDALTGQGLADNPYWDGNPDSNRSKIYSSGLRNPFRFSIHPQTGEPWIGDVGWNDWEEINRAFSGADMGWPCFEGGLPVPDKQSQYKNTTRCNEYFKTEKSSTPSYAWYRGGIGGAAIGGAFYTGLETSVASEDSVTFPASYNNVFFFGDYDSGTIEYLNIAVNNSVERKLFAKDSVDKSFEFTGMAVAPDGSIYLVTPNPGIAMRRIIYSDKPIVKPPPVAKDLPTILIESHNDGDIFSFNETVEFSGSATDVDGNVLESGQLEWLVRLKHFNHLHSYVEATGSSGSFLVRNHEDEGYIELCLKGTDSKARAAQRCVDLIPKRATLTLESSPSGIPLTYIDAGNTTAKPAPFNSNVVARTQRQLSAPETVSLAGQRYKFVAWEHEGESVSTALLSFTTQTTAMTYKAIYELE